MKKLRHIEIYRTQACWVCKVWFTVETANQFTPEEHMVERVGRWMWSALFHGMRTARIVANKLKAKRGEREALGW